MLAAVLADCLTAPLAVVLENDGHATKRLTAEHAEARIKLENGLHVEDLREVCEHSCRWWGWEVRMGVRR